MFMQRNHSWIILLAAILILLLAGEASGQLVKIRDITEIQGMRDNQLTGVGLVTGLDGTGDGTSATRQLIVNLLRKMNINVSQSDVNAGNVAIVMVMATLPPFAKPGNTIDVTVTSIGDSSSLNGGVLVQTPLKGAASNNVYAVAQGPVSTGGFAASGASASLQKNHTTAGMIPDGAIVEREVPMKIFDKRSGSILFTLKNPDFTTAHRMAAVVNEKFKGAAYPLDMKTIAVKLPKGFAEEDLVGFISDVQSLRLIPSTLARVIINERTGTIVAGADVLVSTVAITHGDLIISIAESPEVSQPNPWALGKTTVVDRTDLSVAEEKSNFVVVPGNASVADLAQALNAIGATPRDLVVIFQLIKRAGALHAKLEVM